MKKEDLMEAVGMADESYIEEASPGKIQPIKGRKLVKFVPLIAAGFVVACLGLFMKDRWLLKNAVTQEAAGAPKEAENYDFDADGAVSGDVEAVEECAAEAADALPEPEAPDMEEAAALEETAADMPAGETCAETLAAASEEILETYAETQTAETAVIYEYDTDGIRYELTEIAGTPGFPYTMLLYVEGAPDIYDKLSLRSSESGKNEAFVFPKQAGKPARILIAYRDTESLKEDRLTLDLYPSGGEMKTVKAEPGKFTVEADISDRFSEVIDSILTMFNFK